MKLRSRLAVRLTAALVAVTFLTAASLLGGLYYFSVKRPIDEVKAKVSAESRALEFVYARRGEAALKAALLDRRRVGSPDRAFEALLDRDGTLLFGNLPSWPQARRGDWLMIEADLYRDGDEDDHEALSRDVLLHDGRRLIVGRDVEILADRKELMTEAAQWGALSVVLFGLVGGLVISMITARRLDSVIATSRSVMRGDLDVRVPIRGSGDDFDQLGMSLNAMLDRNQELLASLGRISDNIAHELRTPLARLRTALDSAINGEDIDAGRIDSARVEAQRLQQTFDSLLRIARLDTGRHRIGMARVELDRLVEDAVEFYEPEADARRQRLGLSVTPCVVSGDRNLLFQAVSNLLDNALKFAPEQGDVAVELTVDGRAARIAVTDSGSGVSAEHLPRLTERFYRAPGSERTGGTGLGLTLVDAIASAHDGALSFEGAAGSFSAILRLPIRNR
ncbi:MAG TPA: ATP-binding protein [Sphingomicrobium sp.]|nr:ATP-binding protein [Sphingomicrobium sp.]